MSFFNNLFGGEDASKEPERAQAAATLSEQRIRQLQQELAQYKNALGIYRICLFFCDCYLIHLLSGTKRRNTNPLKVAKGFFFSFGAKLSSPLLTAL
jgi:hypothetical protein